MLKPWLWLPAKWAHDLGPYGLKILSLFYSQPTPSWKSFKYNNLVFKNRLGTAGGVDKTGESLNSWEKLGCGFLEIGTITPLPQGPNPGKIIDRDLDSKSLWNKMGFPSPGADEVYYNVRNFKTHSQTPVFINIGKNRTTPNEEAAKDYLYLIERFQDVADAFVLNISSPNTKGLRDLAKKENLELFLKPILQYKIDNHIKSSLLLKISPDLENADLQNVIATGIDLGLDGFILTNTTLSRSSNTTYPNEGGVSGAPLCQLSVEALKTAVEICKQKKSKKLIISTGGVMTVEDVFERIEMGADLVQVYTTLIFEGPFFFRKVANFVLRGKTETKN